MSPIRSADLPHSGIAAPAPADSAAMVLADGAHRLREALAAEHNPVGATETLLIDEIARRAAKLADIDAASAALARAGAGAIVGVGPPAGGDDAHAASAAMGMSGGRVLELDRSGLGHARALIRGVEVLWSVQAARQCRDAQQLAQPDARFASEQACLAHLVRRFRAGTCNCRCGAVAGHFIPSRLCWECRGCRRQIGIRSGTVMYRSRLPLVPWFWAIRLVLLRPAISAEELRRTLALARAATARGMLGKIRAAMAADDASDRLAGLDGVYLIA